MEEREVNVAQETLYDIDIFSIGEWGTIGPLMEDVYMRTWYPMNERHMARELSSAIPVRLDNWGRPERALPVLDL